jgi:hypothetical protein
MAFFKKWTGHSSHSKARNRTHLRVEALESRVVPYAVVGGPWPHPQVISLSFVPDGTELGGVSSNLFATFNAEFGSAYAWQHQIIRAAEQWARNANINFSVIGDNGTAIGGGFYQQGDPGMGDIRIGGYNFGTTDLAAAYYPPPVNNYSVAGDIQFNTAQPFNNGGGLAYDLFTVAMHEIGHALSLGESPSVPAAMFPVYLGPKAGLSCDDITGIQSIYGKRAADIFAPNNSFGTAANINPYINPTTLVGQLTTLDITTTSDPGFYIFTAPANTSGTLTLTVQSSGLSLLRQSVQVYNSSLGLLAAAAGTGDLGSAVTVTAGMVPGQQYYIVISGADTSAWATGAYGMTINLGRSASPPLPLPNTATVDGYPFVSGGGAPEQTNVGQNGDPRGADTFDGRPSSTAATPVALVAPALVTPTILIAAVASPGQTMGIAPAPDAAFVTVAGTPLLQFYRESGGGDGAVNTADPMSLEQAPAPVPSEQSLPIQQNGDEQLFDSGMTASQWRDASMACFADAGRSRVTEKSHEGPSPVQFVEPSVVDSAAMLTGLAVVLGGYWGVPAERDNVSNANRAPKHIR